jgi:hypothetical protein
MPKGHDHAAARSGFIEPTSSLRHQRARAVDRRRRYRLPTCQRQLSDENSPAGSAWTSRRGHDGFGYRAL